MRRDFLTGFSQKAEPNQSLQSVIDNMKEPRTLTELMKGTGLTKAEVMYHLNVLNKLGHIRIENNKYVYLDD